MLGSVGDVFLAELFYLLERYTIYCHSGGFSMCFQDAIEFYPIW